MTHAPPSLIVSKDTLRALRVPPRQALTRKWPVLHAGTTPAFDRARWTFHVFGLVEKPWECSYDEFLALPHVQVKAAGGVRDLDALLKVRTLGVTRCGATRTADMLEETRRRLGLEPIRAAGGQTQTAGY